MQKCVIFGFFCVFVFEGVKYNIFVNIIVFNVGIVMIKIIFFEEFVQVFKFDYIVFFVFVFFSDKVFNFIGGFYEVGSGWVG